MRRIGRPRRHSDPSRQLMSLFTAMNDRFGDLRWWPGDTPLEIAAGAILTQNTAWTNVEKALDAVKAAGALSEKALLDMPESDLSGLIRSSGYHNLKTRRLKAFLCFVRDGFGGRVAAMAAANTASLRENLLKVHGIGEETADSILLYACGHPVFVVDAYTRRILTRHRLIHGQETYAQVQALFMTHLPADERLFNQYHGLLVETAKQFCRKVPSCEGCPLEALHPTEGDRAFHVKPPRGSR